MCAVTGPPPVSLRGRNRGTDAHLANARVAIRADWKTVAAFAALVLGFVMLLILLDLIH